MKMLKYSDTSSLDMEASNKTPSVYPIIETPQYAVLLSSVKKINGEMKSNKLKIFNRDYQLMLHIRPQTQLEMLL
jgi:hypothetical protein